MNFLDLGLDSEIVDRLSREGILIPTPIQEECFPKIFSGSPVLGLSKTGTGKTLAYLLPLAQKVRSLTEPGIAVCVLVPTRELATQVARDVVFLSGTEEAVAVVVGGESEDRQIAAIKTARFLIATPGRLLDLMSRKIVNLDFLKTLVFDEADRLLDMGFVDDMREIRKYVPKDVQLLFFSATLHFGIDEMAYEFGAGAEMLQQVGQSSDELTVEGLDHRVAFVGDDEKFHALVNFLQDRPDKCGIVFSNYRDKAGMIATRLKGLGCSTEVLTAQLNQSQRTRIMELFRNQKLSVLIASDLAARGLDVFHLDYVINYDLPEDPATYVHRVGRTARAGRKGIALSFVGFEDSYRLERLEKFLKQKIDRHEVDTKQLSGRLNRFDGRAEGGREDARGNNRQDVAHEKVTGQPELPHEIVGSPAPRTEAPRNQPPRAQAPREPGPGFVKTPTPAVPARVEAAPVAPLGWLGRILVAIKKLFGIAGTEAANNADASTRSQMQKPNSEAQGHRRPDGGGGSRNAGRSSGGGRSGGRSHSGGSRSSGPRGSDPRGNDHRGSDRGPNRGNDYRGNDSRQSRPRDGESGRRPVGGPTGRSRSGGGRGGPRGSGPAGGGGSSGPTGAGGGSSPA